MDRCSKPPRRASGIPALKKARHLGQGETGRSILQPRTLAPNRARRIEYGIRAKPSQAGNVEKRAREVGDLPWYGRAVWAKTDLHSSEGLWCLLPFAARTDSRYRSNRGG